jgi:hypothetical protein
VAGWPLITIAAAPLVAELIAAHSIARTGTEQLCSVRRQSRSRDVVEIYMPHVDPSKGTHEIASGIAVPRA